MTSVLGLDMGAGLTKIARITGPGQPEGTVQLMPTAVAYRGLNAEIPGLAWTDPGAALGADEAATPALRCEGFSRLQNGPAQAQIPVFNHRTASEVTQDFLRLALAREDVTGPQGPAAGLVAAVPPVHQYGSPQGSGTAELARILAVLGWTGSRFVPAPIASLLYLRDRQPSLASLSRFVVCDVGAGAATFSLCAFDAGRSRITGLRQVTCPEVWPDTTRSRADQEEQPMLLAEGLTAALLRSAGSDQQGRSRPGDWRVLERAWADQDERDRLAVALRLAAEDPRYYAGTRALRLAGRDLTAGQVLQACAPLAQACAESLAGLLGGSSGWQPLSDGSAPRLVLLGGLSALTPIRTALLTAAGLDPSEPGAAVVAPDWPAQIQAPSMGAALVAAGRADPGDHYPHALRLQAHQQVGGEIVQIYRELARPGQIDLNLDARDFAVDEGGGPLLIQFPAERPDQPIPVEVVPADGSPARPAVFRPQTAPPPGTYRIGVCGGQGRAAVVLQPVGEGSPLIYSLVS